MGWLDEPLPQRLLILGSLAVLCADGKALLLGKVQIRGRKLRPKWLEFGKGQQAPCPPVRGSPQRGSGWSRECLQYYSYATYDTQDDLFRHYTAYKTLLMIC